jgi:hypothetical protein
MARIPNVKIAEKLLADSELNGGRRQMTISKEDPEETLYCGHPKQCYYFHPALIGGNRHRCVACDDPKGNTVAAQKLIKDGIILKG